MCWSSYLPIKNVAWANTQQSLSKNLNIEQLNYQLTWEQMKKRFVGLDVNKLYACNLSGQRVLAIPSKFWIRFEKYKHSRILRRCSLIYSYTTVCTSRSYSDRKNYQLCVIKLDQAAEFCRLSDPIPGENLGVSFNNTGYVMYFIVKFQVFLHELN